MDDKSYLEKIEEWRFNLKNLEIIFSFYCGVFEIAAKNAKDDPGNIFQGGNRENHSTGSDLQACHVQK